LASQVTTNTKPSYSGPLLLCDKIKSMKFRLIFQISISLLLTVTILLQARGTGLGSTWGGTGASFRSKRGAEKFLFATTIILATLFILTSLINISQ
jgi:protein translocase SecG subunit